MFFWIFCKLIDHYNGRAPKCKICGEETRLFLAHSRFLGYPVFICALHKEIIGIKVKV